MNQFLLQQGSFKELVLFPHIIELALKKNHSQNHSIYAGYFNIFEKLSTKLFDEFEAIATLQQKGAIHKKLNDEFYKQYFHYLTTKQTAL